MMSVKMLTSLAICSVALVLCARTMVRQASQFLSVNGGPSLTRQQIRTVTAIFVCTGAVLMITAAINAFPWQSVAKCIVLLAWGIPMVLLDARNYWLPLRYTTGFWLTGLLFTLLPESQLSPVTALISSLSMFACLYAFYLCSRFLRGYEGFGLGDVHLIAALCAWLPWQLASLLSGCAFLLFAVVALLTGKKFQPYAPWLFAVLAGLGGCFPQQTLLGVL
jgi:leader peptidase (prepilin peptidase)/N-methyltransferase